MNTKIKWLISLIAAAVVVAGGVSYGIYKHNQPLSDEAFNKLEIDKQFEKAPAGHYIHLRKDDPTLYRTTWSAKQIKNYFFNKYNIGVKTRADGTTAEKTKLGTNHLFDNNRLVDKQQGYGEIGRIYHETYGNNKFNSGITYYSDSVYNWYFKSPEQAQKDPDVKENVNQLVR